jgi:hypothetical protein
MGENMYTLYTTGFLPPDAGPGGMRCTWCRLPVALSLNHEPITGEVPVVKGVPTLPPLVWGEDVDVICWCCSFNDCEHKPRRSASTREPAIKLVGEEK